MRRSKRVQDQAEVPSRSLVRRQEDTLAKKMINKLIGSKYVAVAKSWLPTMAVWGSVGGVALVHFTDWRLFLDYVPYISGKFKKDE